MVFPETREVGAIDVKHRSRPLREVREGRKRGYPRYGRRRERGLCGIVDLPVVFSVRRVDPGLRRQNGRLRRSANEAFGMSLLSFENGSGAERW